MLSRSGAVLVRSSASFAPSPFTSLSRFPLLIHTKNRSTTHQPTHAAQSGRFSHSEENDADVDEIAEELDLPIEAPNRFFPPRKDANLQALKVDEDEALDDAEDRYDNEEYNEEGDEEDGAMEHHDGENEAEGYYARSGEGVEGMQEEYYPEMEQRDDGEYEENQYNEENDEQNEEENEDEDEDDEDDEEEEEDELEELEEDEELDDEDERNHAGGEVGDPELAEKQRLVKLKYGVDTEWEETTNSFKAIPRDYGIPETLLPKQIVLPYETELKLKMGHTLESIAEDIMNDTDITAQEILYGDNDAVYGPDAIRQMREASERGERSDIDIARQVYAEEFQEGRGEEEGDYEEDGEYELAEGEEGEERELAEGEEGQMRQLAEGEQGEMRQELAEGEEGEEDEEDEEGKQLAEGEDGDDAEVYELVEGKEGENGEGEEIQLEEGGEEEAKDGEDAEEYQLEEGEDGEDGEELEEDGEEYELEGEEGEEGDELEEGEDGDEYELDGEEGEEELAEGEEGEEEMLAEGEEGDEQLAEGEEGDEELLAEGEEGDEDLEEAHSELTEAAEELPEFTKDCSNVECDQGYCAVEPVPFNPTAAQIAGIKCTCLRRSYLEAKLEDQLYQAQQIHHEAYTQKFTELVKEARRVIPIYNEKKNYYQLNEFYYKCQKAMQDWESQYTIAENAYGRITKLLDTMSEADKKKVKDLYEANKWVQLMTVVQKAENPQLSISAPVKPKPPKQKKKQAKPLGSFLKGGKFDDQGYEIDYTDIGAVRATYIKRPIFSSSRDLGFGNYKQKEMPNFANKSEREKWLAKHPYVKDTSPEVIHPASVDKGKEPSAQKLTPAVKADTDTTYILRIPGEADYEARIKAVNQHYMTTRKIVEKARQDLERGRVPVESRVGVQDTLNSLDEMDKHYKDLFTGVGL